MKKFYIVLVALLFVQLGVSAQKSVKIYIVRHAEKEVYDPKDRDPALSEVGKARAEALMKELKGKKIDSIFSTNYKRTKLTGFPLADKIGISIKTYDPAEHKAMAARLIANAKGKNILIIGHSNTLLDIIEAFGGEKPLKELSDEDYDYLFELVVKGDKVDVKTTHFGAKHHSEGQSTKTTM